jgi:DNA-binding response OmpR family regulator
MAGEPLANILVVDDSEAVCKALRDVLTLSGYAVRTAPSGERAMQIMETAQMDLIITDLKMSGMSGIQLLKKVKDKTPSLPVIILTGFGDMDSVIEAMRAGVADYLKKPFSINEVLQVTERELRRSREIQAAAAAPVSPPSPAALLPTGKTPSLSFSAKEMERIDAALSELRAQTTAESVMLIEEAGCVISSKGMLNGGNLPSLCALVLNCRSTTAQVASLLGEDRSFPLHYLEGLRVAVYAAEINPVLILVAVVPKSVKQGAVWVYAKKAVTEIERISVRAVGQAAPITPVEPAVPVPSPEPPSSPQPEPAPRSPEPMAAKPEPVADLDIMFSEETLSAGNELADSVQTLTWEEAMARGLLGDMSMGA